LALMHQLLVQWVVQGLPIAQAAQVLVAPSQYEVDGQLLSVLQPQGCALPGLVHKEPLLLPTQLPQVVPSQHSV
jgi:hypothetical protein